VVTILLVVASDVNIMVMNILFIENDSRRVAQVAAALININPAIEFSSCSSIEEAQSILLGNILVPDVIYFSYGKQHQETLTFLRTIKHRRKHVIIFCLVASELTETDINAFASLGVHYFLDRNVFFKKLKGILTTIQKTLCMAKS
jgi:response regulator RpfG family c-di-GMP phosphodiesterase